MRHSVSILAAIAMLAPVPALAQIETVDPDLAAAAEPVIDSESIDRLGDPETQQQLATTIATLSEILLDLPLAPLANAVADAGIDLAEEVPEDTTLRQLAPEAEQVPDQIAENLPRAMTAMASMAQGIEAMMPALRDMAERMKDALPRDIAPES
ncbi:hypothetical protein [Altererythrobacter sp. MF3-039]|uniref:hypothetical protein n=1 Tax=Altererythrobacter sp. MF3-039 TaxID=3252901 RepID=UPI00390CB4F4